jgi:hypothetical protein
MRPARLVLNAWFSLGDIPHTFSLFPILALRSLIPTPANISCLSLQQIKAKPYPPQLTKLLASAVLHKSSPLRLTIGCSWGAYYGLRNFPPHCCPRFTEPGLDSYRRQNPKSLSASSGQRSVLSIQHPVFGPA